MGLQAADFKDHSLKDRICAGDCGISSDRGVSATLNLRNLKVELARPNLNPRRLTALAIWSFSKDLTSTEEVGPWASLRGLGFVKRGALFSIFNS